MDADGRIQGLGDARQRSLFDAEAAEVFAALPPPPPARPARMPRIVWLYWGQGWEAAPEICRLCLENWRRWNPGHDIRALDAAAAEALLGPPGFDASALPERLRANLLRLRLLERFGGVWADATVFCTAPLDAWLPLLTQRGGCFLFTVREAEKRIATWFIAGSPGSPLLARWAALYGGLLARHVGTGRRLPFYFVIHRAFVVLLRLSPDAAADWALCPDIPANGPLALGNLLDIEQRRGAAQDRPLSEEEARRASAILAGFPLHKLSWKKAMEEGTPRARSALALCRRALSAAPAAQGQ